MTTKLTDKNISNVANLGLQWQSVITADGSTTTTAVAGQGYFIDTTSAAHTINLPASATAGDTIAIKDYAGTFATNALTIGRNGHNIQGVANNSQISTNRASLELVYIDSTKGWLFSNESNVSVSPFMSATGGTVTTSGDYKVHVFTGDGCFVVSNAGPGNADYLVVAGGGSGGIGDIGGAGGAGGFRVSNSLGDIPAPTMSPLSNPTGVTLSSTTYPVTVGAGGAAVSGTPTCRPASNPGSNSIFSTITSTGGGGGGSGSPGGPAGNGGSGGGAMYNGTAGSGNTPPVSPSQGNNGGSASSCSPSYGAGGGGGAGAVGGNGTSTAGGAGGVGSYVSPSFAVGCAGTTGPVGSVRYFAGGGGGAVDGNTPGRQGAAGGAGGGGRGYATDAGQCAVSGTSNTGGGGGGTEAGAIPSSTSGAGGKGIVIIRYKYQ